MATSRRAFLAQAAASAIAAAGCARIATKTGGGDAGEADVAPAEDLMREHGGLNRILLIYDDTIRRIDARTPFRGDVLADAAGIVARFIEGYHEKLEEEFLFPRFEQRGRLVQLVTVLRTQHERGRALTSEIRAHASAADRPARGQLRQALGLFVRMYRPHEAREDTVLFPAFKELVSRKEYDELGERFEAREHELFGDRGFDGIVTEIAQLEREVGLYDLAQFTPP